MHEEAQGVDQPAQYQMITAQQVKGHLRSSREILHFMFCMYINVLLLSLVQTFQSDAFKFA